MRVAPLIVVALLALPVAAASGYTGICFLDALLRGLDYASVRINNLINPTTTTTTVPTTTTTESTTTTTEYVPTTTTTTTTTTYTTTTVFLGKCRSNDDCPVTIDYRCDFDGNLVRVTGTYFCDDPGMQNSTCKGRQASRVAEICGQEKVCVVGQDHCINKN